jgi:hypothetical protein
MANPWVWIPVFVQKRAGELLKRWEIIDRVFRGCFLIFKLSLIHLLG